MAEIPNAFTVDVEDYYHVSAFERDISRSDWDSFESRVVRNTHEILRILERYGVKGTFFVLGWVASRFPQLVRDIHRDGHELGSHSFWHRLVYQQRPEEFRQDLRQSRDVIENIISAPVTAYRAPSFSITKKSLWALDILVEEGFRVDSSIFPAYHDRYGIPAAPRVIHAIETSYGRLLEFPPSVFRICQHNIPVAGGGYFRLYPGFFTRYVLHQVNRGLNHPFMFYIHPWEIDPDQPRLRVASGLSRFRHYIHLNRTRPKLHSLLREFEFGRMCDIVSRSITSSDSSETISSEMWQ